MKTSENSPTKRTVIPKKSTTFANERTKRVRYECILTVLPHCVTHSNWTLRLNVRRLWYRIKCRLILADKKGYFQIPSESQGSQAVISKKIAAFFLLPRQGGLRPLSWRRWAWAWGRSSTFQMRRRGTFLWGLLLASFLSFKVKHEPQLFGEWI